ncbi:DUF6542 domain-containing protein [Streptomyces sp. GESEQ-4]|uniref:DUF6542 domain-containing protein n=1 Tax=Streptomyces sp. GESEQ-4 TaxID=2812655 RepID=UPI001B325971|nr:DUF6542 domain-containing protein [Streptomyces sp. GESEQ-4]
MEQHRTRSPRDGTPRGTPRLPPQGRGPGGRPQERPPGAGVRRPAPPVVLAVRRIARAVRRMPNPRLTGLGGGLFCGVLMLASGCLDSLLFGSSTTVYGVLFLPVCVLTAVWIRKADLVTAPVVVPIAFAVGLLPVADGSDGADGRLMGFVTALATEAGWLYGGTLIAGVIVTVRRVRWVRRRRRA